MIVDLADKNDYHELAKQLDEEGFPYNINSANALNNWNAMHFAVFNDNVDMVSLLRKYGGKVKGVFYLDRHQHWLWTESYAYSRQREIIKNVLKINRV